MACKFKKGIFEIGFWPISGLAAKSPSDRYTGTAAYTEKHAAYRSKRASDLFKLTTDGVKPVTHPSQGVFEVTPEGMKPLSRAGDIDSNHEICLSQRVSGATLFKWLDKTRPTWVYAVFIPQGKEFITHNRQIHDGFPYA